MPPDWQQQFVAALTDVEAPLPAGATPRRFAVYRNNIAVGQAEALAASFPAVRALVGEDFFAALAAVYRRASPPRGPVLAEWGADFGDFLEGFPPVAELPYLADVARVEFARLTALHAADATALPIAALGAVTADQMPELRLRLHPSVHLIDSAWPVVSLRAAALDPALAAMVDMTRAEVALVARPADHLLTQAIDPGLAALLRGVMAGQKLGELALGLGESDFAPALARVFGLGLIIGWE